MHVVIQACKAWRTLKNWGPYQKRMMGMKKVHPLKQWRAPMMLSMAFSKAALLEGC